MNSTSHGQDDIESHPDIDTPNKDGTWNAVADHDEIHNLLLCRNHEHFQHAYTTLFREAGPLAYHINLENPGNSINKILQGEEMKWENVSATDEELIVELQQCADFEIDLTILAKDFKKNFRQMKGNKASPPSGWHIGHSDSV